MRVAISSGPLSDQNSVRGIGHHTKQLLKYLKKLESPKFSIKAVDFKGVDLSGYDVVHYPYFRPFFITLPFIKPRAKVVVTIHDLIPLLYPKHYPPGLKGKIRFYFQKFLIKQADKIITISEKAKNDIVRLLDINPTKVSVIYLAAEEIYKKITDNKLLSQIKNKYNLPDKFVLYLGDINYNKNLPALIDACGKINITLVIVGKQALDIENEGFDVRSMRGPMDWYRYIFNLPHPETAHYKRLLGQFLDNKNILRLGYVSDEDLVSIYNLASVFCQPSFDEGFGLNSLKALACQLPVVASDIKVHREVLGDAVTYANPHKQGDFAEKIREVLNNTNLRTGLIKKGLNRLKPYSYEKTARQTLSVYKEVDKNW